MKEELQDQINKLNREIDKIDKKKSELIKLGESNDLDFVRGRFINRENVYGAFWDTTYYSHFDGHKSSAVHDVNEGAIEITDDNFNKLKSLILEYKALPKPTMGSNVKEEINRLEEEASLSIEEVGPECLHYGYIILRYFEIVDEHTLKWAYIGSQDQGELLAGSSVIIRHATKKEINAVKWVEETVYN